MTQFQPRTGITRNVADVARLYAVFRHDPELRTDASVADRSTTRLYRLATNSFEKRISWRRNAARKQEFDRRIQEIFL